MDLCLTHHTRTRLRSPTAVAAVALAIIAVVSCPTGAQNSGFSGAVRRATAFTADLTLRSVKPIDLEGRGLTTTAFGGLTVGVSSVQVVDTSALRVHVYLLNNGAEAVRIPVPPEDSFAVVDARGRRLILLASPKFERLPKGASELTVPSLERVEFVLLFTKIPADAADVTIKVGAAGVIRGIPLHADGGAAFAAASAVAPGYPGIPTAPGSSPSPTYPPSTPSAGSPATPGGTPGGPPPWALPPGQPAAPMPSTPTAAAPYPTPSPSPFPQSAAGPNGVAPTTPGALAGDWYEPTTLAAIRLNPDGTYTNIVAGGGGNFAATTYSNIIAAGNTQVYAKNPVAGGGASIVAGGGGNFVGLAGGSIIAAIGVPLRGS
jgi:hypothetical protein